MAMAMAYDWGDFPMEIVAKIREHVELYDDYEAFAEICSSWRLAIKQFPCQYINRKHTQLPWLMLVDPDDSPYRRYYSLTKCKYVKIDLPPCLSAPQIRRYFSSQGWLISMNHNIQNYSISTPANRSFNISLFNPFSNNNVTIEPPLFHVISIVNWKDDMLLSFFGKFAVSTSPLSKAHANSNDDDFVVAMTFGGQRKLAYWRLGQDDSWVVPYSLGLNTGWFFDLCFFRGEIYAIDSDSKVIAFGDFKDLKNRRQPRVVGDVLSLIGNRHGLGDDGDPDDSAFETYTYYLVESKCDQGDTSSLLVVHRLVSVECEKEYETISFRVFKLNVDNGKVEQVKSLGNQAIFVGYNSTFTVQACANVDDDQGCKADCIYYTDDNFEVYLFEKGGSDMGIYSLAQGNTHPFYQGPSRFGVINTPMWVEFSSA